jgi:hypothetical protein
VITYVKFRKTDILIFESIFISKIVVSKVKVDNIKLKHIVTQIISQESKLPVSDIIKQINLSRNEKIQDEFLDVLRLAKVHYRLNIFQLINAYFEGHYKIQNNSETSINRQTDLNSLKNIGAHSSIDDAYTVYNKLKKENNLQETQTHLKSINKKANTSEVSLVSSIPQPKSNGTDVNKGVKKNYSEIEIKAKEMNDFHPRIKAQDSFESELVFRDLNPDQELKNVDIIVSVVSRGLKKQAASGVEYIRLRVVDKLSKNGSMVTFDKSKLDLLINLFEGQELQLRKVSVKNDLKFGISIVIKSFSEVVIINKPLPENPKEVQSKLNTTKISGKIIDSEDRIKFYRSCTETLCYKKFNFCRQHKQVNSIITPLLEVKILSNNIKLTLILIGSLVEKVTNFSYSEIIRGNETLKRAKELLMISSKNFMQKSVSITGEKNQDKILVHTLKFD